MNADGKFWCTVRERWEEGRSLVLESEESALLKINNVGRVAFREGRTVLQAKETTELSRGLRPGELSESVSQSVRVLTEDK